MSGSIVENLILKDEFVSEKFNANYLIGNEVAIGFFIGCIQTADADIDLLKSIFRERRIDPVSRGVVSIKMFRAIKDKIDSFDENKNLHWELGINTIDDFSRLSHDLASISNQLGAILEMVESSYKLCFYTILRKFALNDHICTLGRAGLLLKDKFNIECTLFLLNETELFILENWKTESTNEVLMIIEKGSKLIFERNLAPNDSFSILIYVILQAQFSNHNLNLEAFPMIETIIVTYTKNFSMKQKKRLMLLYQELCKKMSFPPNPEIIERLEAGYGNSQAIESPNADFSNSQVLERSNARYSGSQFIERQNPGLGNWQIEGRYNTGRNNSSFGSSFRPLYKERRVNEYSRDYYKNNQGSEKYNNYDRRQYMNKSYFDIGQKNIDDDYYLFIKENYEKFDSVRICFDDIINNLRKNAKMNEPINEYEIIVKVNELADTSSEALFYLLEYYSRIEKYYTNESFSTWICLKGAIDACEFLNVDQYEAVMKNINYIIEKSVR